MKLRLTDPTWREMPQAGEQIRLADGRLARVTKITTRWESVLEPGQLAKRRLLRAELTLDASPKA